MKAIVVSKLIYCPQCLAITKEILSHDNTIIGIDNVVAAIIEENIQGTPLFLLRYIYAEQLRKKLCHPITLIAVTDQDEMEIIKV